MTTLKQANEMSKKQHDTIQPRFTFHKTSADTQGEYLEMEVAYPPRSSRPPSHYHPYQEEHFEVLRGTFRVRMGDLERTYETGEKFTVPPNTHHWMHNISDQEGCLLWQIRPAMKSQAFFETLWGLEADGKTDAQGRPGLLQLAVILHEYSQEFRLTSPPDWVQRLLFGFLSPIGKLLGYRAKYARYSSALSSAGRADANRVKL